MKLSPESRRPVAIEERETDEVGGRRLFTAKQFDLLLRLIDSAADRSASARGSSLSDFESAVRVYEGHREKARKALVGDEDQDV